MATYDIDYTKLGKQRSIYTFNHETYMLHALTAASSSLDPSTQVGACYVGKNGNILSVGCNHIPNNWNVNYFPWGYDENKINDKNTYMIHAEFAAMGNYGGSVSDFKDSTLYVTLFPCLSCSKLLSTLGVKKIVYLNARKECDEFIYASILLKKAGIELVDFKELNPSLSSVTYNLKEDEKNNIKIKRYLKL